MALVDIKSVGDWSDAVTNPFEMVSTCCGVSIVLKTQSTRLSKLEAGSTFIILQPFWMLAFVCSGLGCPDSGIMGPNCRCRGRVRSAQIALAMPTCY